MNRLALKLLLFALAGAIINMALVGSFAWTHDQCTLRTSGADYVWRMRDQPGTELQYVLDRSNPGKCDLVVQNGWPFYCFQARAHIEFDAVVSSKIEGGIELEPASNRRGDTVLPRILPLMPLWSGLVANTAFYASLIWMLIALPFVVRLVLRQRRRLCPTCAYPIGRSPVCTECGTELKGKARADDTFPSKLIVFLLLGAIISSLGDLSTIAHSNDHSFLLDR